VSARIPPLPPPAAASNPIAGTPRKELPSAAPAIWREQATRGGGDRALLAGVCRRLPLFLCLSRGDSSRETRRRSVFMGQTRAE
jgi:hypothetical protein